MTEILLIVTLNNQFTSHITCLTSQLQSTIGVELNLLFNVTKNGISVMHVTSQRCASGLKKKLDLRLGSQRYTHFVGFFNVPVQTLAWDHPFYTFIHRPIYSPFTTRCGYGGHIIGPAWFASAAHNRRTPGPRNVPHPVSAHAHFLTRRSRNPPLCAGEDRPATTGAIWRPIN